MSIAAPLHRRPVDRRLPVDRKLVEQIVREIVLAQVGGPPGKPNLVVSISARHVHLTDQDVETLFGPGLKLISQEQLELELFKAHCLVLPSLREGHPLILFEAWAHQLPVIATDVGSVGRFVNPKNGYLVPAGNVAALTQAMIKEINNKNIQQLGESGFNLIKNYTWGKTAAAYDLALKLIIRSTADAKKSR